MKLNEIGEFGFIDSIRQGCLNRPGNVLKPIGDDAAVIKQDSNEVTLVTTDLLVENIHFLRASTSGFDLGYKSLAVNLSDIAAMGGTAKDAFVSIGIPDTCDVEYIQDIYHGIKSLASEFDVNILGGDTTRSGHDLIINIAVMGSALEDAVMYRSSAKAGDIIFSTGYLGNSRAGLHLILNSIPLDSEALKAMLHTHTLPKPYLHEGKFLAAQKGVHAAIDVSDGLSSDLYHILTESHVGAKIYAEKIPVSDLLIAFCKRFDFDPVEFALAGGEDYTLLVTVDANHAETVAKNYRNKFAQPLFPIGEINDSGKMERVETTGCIRQIRATGWDHFSTFVKEPK